MRELLIFMLLFSLAFCFREEKLEQSSTAITAAIIEASSSSSPSPSSFESTSRPAKDEPAPAISAMTTAMTSTFPEPAAGSSSTESAAPPAATAAVAPESAWPDSYKRRVITYDQRQEGQYNIRADLENFMIVLIPPSPQEGLSLIDLLTKGTLRRSNDKLKHFANNYERNNQPQMSIIESNESLKPKQLMQDFNEGRAPYHVDIGALNADKLKTAAERQVEVLPPAAYPQAQPHLIKPYHQEAEPEIIQALPPPQQIANVGGLLLGYNQLLPQSLAPAEKSAHDKQAYFTRLSRALRGDSYVDTNRLERTEMQEPQKRRTVHVQLPLYRTDVANRAAEGNTLYPPIDVPYDEPDSLADSYFARNWQLSADAGEAVADSADQTPRHFLNKDILQLDLLGDDNFGNSKSLLSDGLARCAPGYRRDSYGVCREIEGY